MSAPDRRDERCPPPACIAEAIKASYVHQHAGSSTGPEPKPEDFTAYCYSDRAAQAVWDALLGEGKVWFIPEHAKPGITTSFTAFGLDPREAHIHANY